MIGIHEGADLHHAAAEEDRSEVADHRPNAIEVNCERDAQGRNKPQNEGQLCEELRGASDYRGPGGDLRKAVLRCARAEPKRGRRS